MPNEKLDTRTLESWLWEAACRIRGPVDAPKFKRLYIAHYIYQKAFRYIR